MTKSLVVFRARPEAIKLFSIIAVLLTITVQARKLKVLEYQKH